MADRPPANTLRDEQHPLLNVAGGEGDKVPAVGWTVSSPRRKSWKDKWPEMVSACWMTIILLSICLLGLYTMGMAVARRQALMVQYLKEHDARQARSHDPQREVFYHHVIERGTPIPFQKYSDYLRQMATTYQNLKFNVIFFTDDSIQSTLKWSRHSKFMNKLLSSSALYRMDKIIKRDISNFQRKYANVNITITSLVKYMSATPLKYKLNHVSLSYLMFYARVYTIWEHGGVALDLPNSNEQFVNEKRLHEAVTATLRNFNDGVKQPPPDASSRNKKESEFDIFFSCWDFVMNEAWNETRNFINNSLVWPPMLLSSTADVKHPRVHRNKREISESNDTQALNTSTSLPINDSSTFISNFNYSEKTTEPSPVLDKWSVTLNTTGTSFHPNKTTIQEFNISSYEITNKNDTKYIEMPHIKFFYDVLLISDAMSPAYGGFDTQTYNINLDSDKNSDDFPKQLLIDSKGRFIAAYSHFHPFLSHLMSMAYRYESSRNCIEDAIMTHCSDFYHRDNYCSTIELL